MQRNTSADFRTGGNSMRSYVASAVLAAAFVLLPAAAGYAPALSQDFSITNETLAGSNWMKQLQAWWDVHAYYPPDALKNHEDGTVKVHLVIPQDGEVGLVQVAQGSGSHTLDMAGYEVFKYARLRPVPSAPPAPQADVFITLHYVLAHQQTKSPFTVTNDPVVGTVVDTMLERTCRGFAVPNPLWFGYHRYWIQATWYHRPDGTKWIRYYQDGRGPDYLPVTELGMSAQWNSPYENKILTHTHFELWPDGDNHISGKTTAPPGTIDMTCQ